MKEKYFQSNDVEGSNWHEVPWHRKGPGQEKVALPNGIIEISQGIHNIGVGIFTVMILKSFGIATTFPRKSEVLSRLFYLF